MISFDITTSPNFWKFPICMRKIKIPWKTHQILRYLRYRFNCFKSNIQKLIFYKIISHTINSFDREFDIIPKLIPWKLQVETPVNGLYRWDGSCRTLRGQSCKQNMAFIYKRVINHKECIKTLFYHYDFKIELNIKLCLSFKDFQILR